MKRKKRINWNDINECRQELNDIRNEAFRLKEWGKEKRRASKYSGGYR